MHTKSRRAASTVERRGSHRLLGRGLGLALSGLFCLPACSDTFLTEKSDFGPADGGGGPVGMDLRPAPPCSSGNTQPFQQYWCLDFTNKTQFDFVGMGVNQWTASPSDPHKCWVLEGGWLKFNTASSCDVDRTTLSTPKLPIGDYRLEMLIHTNLAAPNSFLVQAGTSKGTSTVPAKLDYPFPVVANLNGETFSIVGPNKVAAQPCSGSCEFWIQWLRIEQIVSAADML